MKATIWHNPKCSTSRKTLAILEETPDVEVAVVNYLKSPPTREVLKSLYAKAGITAKAGLRKRAEGASALADADDDAILDAMVADPVLIERPLVQTEKGVRLCRPIDSVREIL
jgi:arsenate reductase